MAVLRFAGDRFSWLSGDTKPTDVLVGSFGIEIDTGDSYYYDGSTWSKTTDVGEVNTVSNVGSGTGVYKSKTGVNFEFKSLVAGNNITFDISNSNEIKIHGTAGTVTSVGLSTGTSGTDINVSGSPITTSGSFTLNIPTASATNRGALSSTDWSTFNSKAGGTGAANKVAFWTGTNTLSYNTNLHWDNTNGRLGIGDVSTLSARVNILAFGNAPALSIRNSSNAYQYLTVDNKGWLSGRGIKGYQITKTNGDAIPTINIAEFNDLLISAEDKYTVTYGNGGTHPNLYLNNEGINWNVTSTDNVIINFKGKSYWPSGITYPGGEIWIGFYYQTHTEDIEVYYEVNTNIGTWVDISSTKEVIYLESSAYKYIKFKVPANINYLSKLKIAINDVAQVERIRYLVDRNSENNYGSFCRKYGDWLFGTYIYRNSSNTAVNVIDCNGNNYFNSGNFGIGTASPGYRLDVNGDLRVVTRTGTPTKLSGFDANGKIMDVTVSTGLTLSSGVLTAQGTTRDLSYGTKSSGVVPLQITGGTSVNFTESPAIFLDRTSSSNMTVQMRAPFGQMSSGSLQRIVNLGLSGGGYKIEFSDYIISNCSIDKVTFSNANDRLIVNTGYAGTYQCTYSVDLLSQDASNDHDVYMIIKINGSEYVSSKSSKVIKAGSDVYHFVSRTFFLPLAVSDYIELFIVKNVGSGTTMDIHNAIVAINYISDEICIPS